MMNQLMASRFFKHAVMTVKGICIHLVMPAEDPQPVSPPPPPKPLSETVVFTSPTFCCYVNNRFPPLVVFHYYIFFFQMNLVLDD